MALLAVVVALETVGLKAWLDAERRDYKCCICAKDYTPVTAWCKASVTDAATVAGITYRTHQAKCAHACADFSKNGAYTVMRDGRRRFYRLVSLDDEHRRRVGACPKSCELLMRGVAAATAYQTKVQGARG